MKNSAKVFILVACVLWLVTAGLLPAQAEVLSIGILPVQDESGVQVPPELLSRIGQDLKQKLTLSYQDIFARSVSGVSGVSALGVEQLAAIGKQQGVRYVLRGGFLSLLSEKSNEELSCNVALYAELITSDSGEIVTLRANGTGLDTNQAIADARNWDAYNFTGSSFGQTALGQALKTAIDQLAQQVHQALAPSGQSPTETVSAEDQPQSPAGEESAASYETDQELQQLIAQAESLVASGAARGDDISSLQQELEGLLASLNNKVSLMEQGQDTTEVDQEIAQRKTELQNYIDASAQQALSQPPEDLPQQESGEVRSGISKLNELLGEALNCILKIQEINTAVQNFGEGQSALPENTDLSEAPIEEPTSDVSGVVADDYGNPVEGATVIDPQSGASAITDSSGSYVIPHIPSGRFATIKVVKAGQQLSSGKIQLQPGRMAFADWQIGAGGTAMKAQGIKILPANVIIASQKGAPATKSGTIKGIVRDHQGKPVPRALVMVKGLGMARTDSHGRYMFVNVPQGEYQVMVRKGAATVQNERVRVAAKKVVENKTIYKGTLLAAPAFGRQAVLVRSAGATLKGTISNKYRQPLPGTKVTAVTSGGAMSVFSDAKGSYAFKNMKQGTYRLLANKAGYQETSVNVSLWGSKSEIRDFMLEKSSAEIQKALTVKPATRFGSTKVTPRTASGRTVVTTNGQLFGVVRDARSGNPIANATVQVSGQNIVRTDRLGIYRISDVLPGTYRVVASHRDYQQEVKTVTIRANNASKEYFSLKGKEPQDNKTTTTPIFLNTFARNGKVQGKIIDSKTGNPVSQATVILGEQETRSDDSGDYSFRAIPVGSYTMTIKKSDYLDSSRKIAVSAGKTISANFRLIPKSGTQLKKRIVPYFRPSTESK
jgi:hypothetical protein